MDAATTGGALAAPIEIELPAMPGTSPKPAFVQPPLSQIAALMWTKPVD